MPTDSQKAIENFRHYEYSRDNGHRAFVEKAKKCENFYYGEHWEPEVEQKLRAESKPILTINKIFSTMSTIQGEQMNSSADISFKASAGGDPATAEALSKMWLHIANSNNFTEVEESVFLSGAITSRGFFDVRISFEDSLRGEIAITKHKAKNVVLDPDGDTYDPKSWSQVFLTTWMTPHMISMKYGKDKGKIFETRTASQYSLGYDSLDYISNTFSTSHSSAFGVVGSSESLSGSNSSTGSVAGDSEERQRKFVRIIERQYKTMQRKPHFVDRQNGDIRVIPENWDDSRIGYAVEQYGLAVVEKNAEVYRWTVSADDILLFDSDMPDAGFTIIPYFPFFYEGKTIGMVENLISPQELLNKAESQELHIINTTANSGWKIRSGSLRNMDVDDLETKGAETGLVLELDDVNNAEKILPNQVPTGLDRVSYKAAENLKEISGISDSQRGFDRADVAAKAIRAKQQAGSINLAAPIKNLLQTRHLLASRVLHLMQTYYTEHRVAHIAGNTLSHEYSTVEVNAPSDNGGVVNDLTIGEYSVVVTDVPKQDTLDDQQFFEAVELRNLGVAIPDHVLVSASHLRNKDEIVSEMTGADESEEQQHQQQLEQQLAELEVQAKQLELEKIKAEVINTKAQAAASLSGAQDASGAPEDNSEAIKLANEQEQFNRELALKKEDLAANILLKKQELALKEKEINIKKAQADIQYKDQQKKASEKPSSKK